jgi:hypothetical protein
MAITRPDRYEPVRSGEIYISGHQQAIFPPVVFSETGCLSEEQMLSLLFRLQLYLRNSCVL